jgi:hypothetical protein
MATPTVSRTAPLTTAVSVLPPHTCVLGSMTEFLGTAYGSESFPPGLAIVFSNGPCGRVIPGVVPVEELMMNDPTIPGQYQTG